MAPVRLVILSRSSSIYSTRRLVEAARERKMKVRVLNPVDCEMHLDGAAAHLYYRRKPLGRTDVVISRIAPSISNYGLAVVNQFGLSGVTLVNDAQAIAQSRNKMRSLQLLAANGIGIPATVMAHNARDLKEMVSLVGGFPVLVKLLQGGERQGVMICETKPSLEAALEAILGLGQNLIVQEYVRETRGKDIRALVVGGRLVCAVRRTPERGRLSRTLARGAEFEPLSISARYEATALAAARIVGLEIAAIDMLEQPSGPKVFEVNSSPGLRGLEEASGLDLAGIIVDHAARLVRTAHAKTHSLMPLPQPPPADDPVTPPRRKRKTVKRSGASKTAKSRPS